MFITQAVSYTHLDVYKRQVYIAATVLTPARLDNDTHHSARRIVDDLLHRILQLFLAFFPDHRNLCTNTIVDQLLHSFSENIRFPDAVLFSRLIDITDQVFRLLLCPDDRGDFRHNRCADKV